MSGGKGGKGRGREEGKGRRKSWLFFSMFKITGIVSEVIDLYLKCLYQNMLERMDQVYIRIIMKKKIKKEKKN